MKTIEERAIKWSGFKDCHSTLKEVCLKNGYIHGATEQRAVDIDKAYEWLRARNVLTDASLEGFRKAMEGDGGQ